MSQLENAPIDVESNDESDADDKAEAGASLLSDLATSSSSSDE